MDKSSTKPSHSKKVQHQRAPSHLEKLLRSSTYPVIGLGYVIELREKERPDGPSLYKCVLCHLDVGPEAIVAHLKGRVHNLNYMKTHFLTEYKVLKEKRLPRDDLKTYLVTWAAELKKRLRPETPIQDIYYADYPDRSPPLPGSTEDERRSGAASSSLSPLQQIVMGLKERKFKGQIIEHQKDLEDALDAIDYLTEQALTHHFKSFPEKFRKEIIKIFLENRRNHIDDQVERTKDFYIFLKENVDSFMEEEYNQTMPLWPGNLPPEIFEEEAVDLIDLTTERTGEESSPSKSIDEEVIQ